MLMLPWATTATVTEGLAALLLASRPRVPAAYCTKVLTVPSKSTITYLHFTFQLARETTELLLNLGINSPHKLETEMIKLGQTTEVCGIIEGNEVASKTEEQSKCLSDSHCFNGTKLHDENCKQLQVISDLNITNDVDLRKRKEIENEDLSPSYICEHCNTKCTNQHTLLLHMEKEHDVESKIIVKCKEKGCNYETSSNKYLKNHNRRVHSGMKHLCNACGRAFGDKRELVSHNIAIHEEKNLPCSYCDKLYPSEKHRERHERLVHATELAYQCDECPQSYKHPSSLHKHKLSVHRGEEGKKFKCDQCDMAFITNGKLTHHKRSHTGEKHYACPYCGMGFIDPSAMSRHRKTHEGGAKFECDLCPKTYTQSYDVVKHKMAVHGVIIKSKRQHVNKEKKLKRYQKPGRFSEEVLGINLS